MRSSITSKQSKSLLALCVPGLLLAYAGCGGGETAPPANNGQITGAGTANAGAGAGNGGSGVAGSSGSGGNVNPAGGTAGNNVGGAAPGGTGGVAGGTGGVSGGGAGAAGGAPGGTGGGPSMGGACSTAMGTNGANLTVKRPEISTRTVANTPAGNMMRIEYDKMSQTIYALAENGTIYVVDPVGNTVMPANTGFPGGSTCRSMTFGPDGSMYVGCGNGGGVSIKVSKGTPGAGGAFTWTTVVSTEGFAGPPGSGANFGHAFNGLAVSPDGMYVYFGSGSRTDHGEDEGGAREVPLSSAVFRAPTAMADQMIMNTEQSAAPFLFADGTRNTFDLAFNDAGDLFGGDNGPDMDLPDEINFLEMGKHYGFPWRFGATDNPVKTQGYTGAGSKCLPPDLQAVSNGSYDAYDATFPAAPAGGFTDPVTNKGPDSDKFRTCPDGDPMDASDATMTLAGITAHKSPLGLNFDTTGALCGDYNKAGFFLTYGTATPDRFLDGGRDLNMARFTKVGAAYEMEVTQLVAGFESAPIDATLVDNKIYVVEYGDGKITEITLPAAQ